jgi:hypothetical protein
MTGRHSQRSDTVDTPRALQSIGVMRVIENHQALRAV